MVKSNYIRVGRLVRVLRGPRANKVAVITDIIDANRVIVENPADEKMWRHVQNLKNVEPTSFKVDISRNSKSPAVKAAMEKAGVVAKFAKTGQGKKIAAVKALAESTDFERYQLRVAKRSRAHWARKIFEENDKKKPVSWHKSMLKKLEKSHKKFEDKKRTQRAARIKKYEAKKKAKKAKKASK